MKPILTKNCFSICGIDWMLQYLVLLAVSLCGMSIALTNGWVSPTLPLLTGPNSPIPVSTSQMTWVANACLLTALISAPIFGSLVDKIGRKPCMLIPAGIHVISWLFISQSTQVWHLILARAIFGLGSGGFLMGTAMFLGEIPEASKRGAYVACFSIMYNSGILFTFFVGPYLSLHSMAYACMCIPMLAFICTLFIPETPHFYVINKDYEKGREVLQLVRGTQDVDEEFTKIKLFIEFETNNKKSVIDVFSDKYNRKSLGLIIGVVFCQQLTGSLTFLMYGQTIFENAGDGIVSPAVSTMFIGIAFVSFMLVALFTVDKFGRKIVLMTSCIGSMVFLILLGVYFYLKNVENYTLSKFQWLPLIALILVNVFQSFGLNVVPSVYFSELFAADIKSYALIILVELITVFSYLGSELFVFAFNNWDLFAIFWIFAFMCLLSLIFIIVFLPETKGLSLDEIQILLRK